MTCYTNIVNNIEGREGNIKALCVYSLDISEMKIPEEDKQMFYLMIDGMVRDCVRNNGLKELDEIFIKASMVTNTILPYFASKQVNYEYKHFPN